MLVVACIVFKAIVARTLPSLAAPHHHHHRHHPSHTPVQVSQLLLLKSSGERVRAHAARFLNLLLAQLAPELLERAEQAPAQPPSAEQRADGPGQGPSERGRGRQVAGAVERAREALGTLLGREAQAMLSRRIALGDGSGGAEADAKLTQLAGALSIFIEL
jgi:hypothetical protein